MLVDAAGNALRSITRGVACVAGDHCCWNVTAHSPPALGRVALYVCPALDRGALHLAEWRCVCALRLAEWRYVLSAPYQHEKVGPPRQA